MCIITLNFGLKTIDYTDTGGDMASTWVANLRVHAEEQITSLIQL